MRSGFEPKKETLGELRGRTSPAGLLMFPSLSVAPTISPSSISELSVSALSLCSPALVLLQSTLLLRGSLLAIQGLGRSVKVSVESGGSSSFSSSSPRSESLFKPLILPLLSSASDAGEPVGSKGSYFSPSPSSPFTPSVGWKGSYISLFLTSSSHLTLCCIVVLGKESNKVLFGVDVGVERHCAVREAEVEDTLATSVPCV